MRRSWMVFLLLFVLALACTLLFCTACKPGGAIREAQEETEQKELAEAVKKPSSVAKITTTEQKDATPDKNVAAGAEKEPTPEIAGKQEDAGTEKTVGAEGKPAAEITAKQEEPKPEKAPAPKVLSELIAILERAKEEKAATKEGMAAEEHLIQEITGLIIEETMTRIGYDFYEYFFLLWEAPQGIAVKDYNILINEKASPMWGSWVRVDVGETTVWSKMLKPRSEEIEDAAKQAVEATKQYLYNYEKHQFQTADMVGTGI